MNVYKAKVAGHFLPAHLIIVARDEAVAKELLVKAMRDEDILKKQHASIREGKVLPAVELIHTTEEHVDVLFSGDY